MLWCSDNISNIRGNKVFDSYFDTSDRDKVLLNSTGRCMDYNNVTGNPCVVFMADKIAVGN